MKTKTYLIAGFSIFFFWFVMGFGIRDCFAYPFSEIVEMRVGEDITKYQTGYTSENVKGFYRSNIKTIYYTDSVDISTLWHERAHAICDHFCTKEDYSLFYYNNCAVKNYWCDPTEQLAREFSWWMITKLHPDNEKKLEVFNKLLTQF